MGRNVHQAHTVRDELAFLLLVFGKADAHLNDVPLVDVQQVRPFGRLLELGVVHHLLGDRLVDLLVVGVARRGSPRALLGKIGDGLQDPLRRVLGVGNLHARQASEVVFLRLGQQGWLDESLREHIGGHVADHLHGAVVGLVRKRGQLLAVLLRNGLLGLGVVECLYKLVNLCGDPLHGGRAVFL